MGWAGVLATSGGVVFSADHEGNFFAADSLTGKKLFEFQTGAAIFAPFRLQESEYRQESADFLCEHTRFELCATGPPG